jgi:hypothetical protein
LNSAQSSVVGGGDSVYLLALLWQIFIAGCIFRIPERRFA